ncbi:MAG TPA: hypothetical protein VN961_23165, partial [Streptosporangiaceae bacterium]|nr:hypothetical protein [Streptosporangiaceae bacterium]
MTVQVTDLATLRVSGPALLAFAADAGAFAALGGQDVGWQALALRADAMMIIARHRLSGDSGIGSRLCYGQAVTAQAHRSLTLKIRQGPRPEIVMHQVRFVKTASPAAAASTAIPPRPAVGCARSARRTWSSPARNRGCSPPRSRYRSSTPTALQDGGAAQEGTPLGHLRAALDELVDAGVLHRQRRDG